MAERAAGAAVRRAAPLAIKLTWGLADQVLSSATNFALGVLVARAASASELGAFGVAYVVYSLALGASRALASEPLVVRFSAGSDEQWASGVASSTGTAVAIGTAVAVPTLVAAGLTSEPLSGALVVLAIALPGLLLQDAWRFSLFARGAPGGAVANDLLWAGLLVPGAVVLEVTGATSLRWLMAMWALAGWASAVLGRAQTGVAPRPRASRRWLRSQGDIAFRFFGEFTVSSGATQLSFFAIGLVTSLRELGELRAGQLVLGPLNILFLGAGLVAVAEVARHVQRSPGRLTEIALLVSALLTVGTLGWAFVAGVVPTSVGERVLGENWSAGRSLLVPLAVSAAGFALSYGAMTGLRALAAARESLRARILDAVATLSFAVSGAALDGARGAAYGYAVAGCARVPNWWWHLRRARRRSAAPEAS